MRAEELDELRRKSLITEAQHAHLFAIKSRSVFSVYYELRIILYLGVMLFTTGVGILIYQNIGDIGHLVSILLLFALTVVCFWYVFKYGHPYSDEKLNGPTPYFDYIVLLGCLLFISVLGYLQFQYEVFDDGMGATTLVTAAFFFYIAYRFDHVGVLTLAITALASFFSISVSPQKWYSDDFFTESNHHHTAMWLGVVFAAAGLYLDRKGIKKHFTFSWMNIASLVYLTGTLTALFIEWEIYGVYLLALYAGCAGVAWFGLKTKSFLFMLYAFIYGYIGTTALIADIVQDVFEFWFFYFFASCGLFIAFIIRYKKLFKRA